MSNLINCALKMKSHGSLCSLSACTRLLQQQCRLTSSVSSTLNATTRIQQLNGLVIQVPPRRFKQEKKALNRIIQNSGFRTFHTSPSSHQNTPDDPKKNDKDDEDNKVSSLLTKAFLWMLTAYMFIAIVSLMFPSSNQPEVIRYVSWNEFVHYMLANGEVEEIVVRPETEIVTIILQDGAVIKGKRAEHKTYHMNIVDIDKFEAKLRDAERKIGVKPDQGVPVVYERVSDSAGKLLASLVIVTLLLSLLSRSKSIRSPLSMDGFMQMSRAKFTLVDPLTGGSKGVRFADVAGLKNVKTEVMEFMDYLKRPDYYKNLGAKVPRGALLLGPPGCGKTLLAKAIATEANVPFLSMNGSEFIEMIGGLGAARVRDLFKEARKRAPCIIYIDEIDAIGRKRSEGGSSFDGASGESEQTLNQLLVEMDGMISKEGVLMIASTNRPDVLDKALLRPGRFDRHILIDLPDLEERKEIFQLHLKGIVLEKEPAYYSHRMAILTPGFSGADIANICNEAALHAARIGEKVVKGSDLEYAVERIVGGIEKRSQAVSPQEKKVVAYHESGHALVGWMLEHTCALLKVTIVPRTNKALGFAQYTPKDQKLFTKEELFEHMCMALGGRVAESLTFNRITTGAQNDLDKVTKMAYSMVKQYGMSESVGLLSFPDEDVKEGRKPYSKRLCNVMDREVRQLVADAYKATEALLKKHKDKLGLMAETLLQKESMSYDDVETLIGPPPFGKKRLIDPVEFESNVNVLNDQESSQPRSGSPQPQELSLPDDHNTPQI